MATPVPHLRLVKGGGPAPEVGERALRDRFCEGDRSAFRALATPHLDTLYTLCLRLTRNHAEAEDLAQETLARALRSCHRFDAKRAFRPWLLRIALNLCRDRLRTVWWRRVVPFAEVPRATGRGPEEVTRARANDRRVREAVACLPPRYREAVSLFHIQDMSYAEMAEITGVKVPALKQRVRRGTVALRAHLLTMYPELAADRSGDV